MNSEQYDFGPQTTCYWGPNCTDCNAYSGNEEDRYPSTCNMCLKKLTNHEGYGDENEIWCNLCAEEAPSHCNNSTPLQYITCCTCGFVECEYYSYRYKCSTYCNKCAFEVCGKQIEKPKFAFTRIKEKTFECALCTENIEWEDRNMVDGNMFCTTCYWHLEMQPKPNLFCQYSNDENAQLARYGNEHNLKMEEALDYQTHCHCCGKFLENPVFDEKNHQYCKERCWETCEEYRYPCFKKGDCKVCPHNEEDN